MVELPSQQQETDEKYDNRENETGEESPIRDDGGSLSQVPSVTDDVMSNLSGLSVSEDVSSGDREHNALSTQEVDVLLDKCLLQALHTSVKDKDLPIPGSALWLVFPFPLFSFSLLIISAQSGTLLYSLFFYLRNHYFCLNYHLFSSPPLSFIKCINRALCHKKETADQGNLISSLKNRTLKDSMNYRVRE